MTKERLEVFWSRIDTNGPIPPHCPDLGRCWIWTAGIFKSGYGYFSIKHRCFLAHRISWELKFGEIPLGLNALHKCDVRLCVNPDHIFLGTLKDNHDDMVRKGRNAKVCGERNAFAKLKNDQVIEIRSLYSAGGITQAALGSRFRVNEKIIQRVITNKSYKNI